MGLTQTTTPSLVATRARTAPRIFSSKTTGSASTPTSASAAKTLLNRLVSGVAPWRSASSPRHKMAMRPRRALDLDMSSRNLASDAFRMGIFELGQRLVMHLAAREADVPELTLIQIGKRPQRISAFVPSLERRAQRQQAVDCHQDEVVVPQVTCCGTLEIFVLDECTRIFEPYRHLLSPNCRQNDAGNRRPAETEHAQSLGKMP